MYRTAGAQWGHLKWPVGEIVKNADAEHLIEQQLDLILVFVKPVLLFDPAHLPLLVETPEDMQTANGGFQRAKEIFLACAVTATIT